MQPLTDGQVQAALDVLQGAFGEALLAVYLHGSAVSGGLQPQSDIDLIAVVGRAVALQERQDLLSALLKLSARHPATVGGPRCLEVMVLLRADLVEPPYPARAELLYGEWLRDAFEAGEMPMPVSDPEITLVLAQAQQEAIAIAGPEAMAFLPTIPLAQVRQAMGELLEPVVAGLSGDERNGMLTLARMWRTAATGDFVPKDVAATWAAARMPGPEAATLLEARDAYMGKAVDTWSNREQQVSRVADFLRGRVAALLSSV